MKRIKSSYKLIEFLSGRGSGPDTVVNVAMVEFRFGAVVLIEKLVFNVAWPVAGSHFGSHGQTIFFSRLIAVAKYSNDAAEQGRTKSLQWRLWQPLYGPCVTLEHSIQPAGISCMLVFF